MDRYDIHTSYARMFCTCSGNCSTATRVVPDTCKQVSVHLSGGIFTGKVGSSSRQCGGVVLP